MLQVRMHRPPPRRFPIDTLRFLATSTRHHAFSPFFLFLLFFLLPSLFLFFFFHNGIKRVACYSKRYITSISLQSLFDIVYIHFFVLFRLFRTFCLWERCDCIAIFEETCNFHLFAISIRVSSWFIYSFIYVLTSRKWKKKNFTRPLYFSIGFFLFERINCNFLSIFE